MKDSGTTPGSQGFGRWLKSAATAILISAAGSAVIASWVWQLWLGAAISSILLAVVLFFAVVPTVRGWLLDYLLRANHEDLIRSLEPTVRGQLEKEYARTMGLERLSPSFVAVEAELVEQLGRSHRADIFLQIGTSVATHNFYDTLARVHLRSDAKVRILKAGRDNPYLSQFAAERRGKNYQVWLDDIASAESKLHTLERMHRTSDQVVQFRNHREGYLWRYWIFDDVAYVQPYLFATDNAEQAPVFTLRRAFGEDSNPQSLYHVFSAHFDQKWLEYRPPVIDIEVELATAREIVVAGILRQDVYGAGGLPSSTVRTFVIPDRYLPRNRKPKPDDHYYYQCPGGKFERGRDTTLINTLKRELFEELGLSENDYTIRSSGVTIFVSERIEFRSEVSGESARPYCIYRHGDQLVVGYEVELSHGARVVPREEIGLVLQLTSDFEKRSTYAALTVREIQGGAPNRVVNAETRGFHPEAIVAPKGLALVVVAPPSPDRVENSGL
jgi:8-oxo-dGTP pyrophosphatase MutT (NUDIX family)